MLATSHLKARITGGLGVVSNTHGQSSSRLSPRQVLEQKLRIKNRKLSLFETIGLWGILPMWHISYSKLDRGDMRQILRTRAG